MRSHIGRRDAAALSALLLLGVGLPLAMAVAAGAIGVPSNDDWVYTLGADGLYRSGSLAMSGHTATAVGQLLLVQPLLWVSGGAPWAFAAFGLGMAGLGLAAAYLLARSVLGPGGSALAALLVVAFPGFARESATFMTDVPAFALQMASLLLGAAWLRGGRRPLLLASLAVGLLAVTIREFAIAAPAAVLAIGWARGRTGDRPLLAALTGITGIGVVVALTVLGSPAVHGGITPPPNSSAAEVPGILRLTLLGPTLTTLAAVLLPAIALAAGLRLRLLRPAHLLAGLVLVGIPFIALTSGPFLGQTWTPDGLTGNDVLSGARGAVFPARFWSLSEQLALFGGFVLAALALHWLGAAVADVRSPRGATERVLELAGRPTALALAFVALYAAELAGAITLQLIPLDRYLYPIVPPAAMLLLSGSTRIWTTGRSQVFAHAALLWLALSSLAIAANSFAYDAARWRAGEAAVAAGYAPQAVDAGYEWVGYQTGGHWTEPTAQYGLSWYDDGLMRTPPCAVVSNGELAVAGYRLLRRDPAAYRQYLFAGPLEPLYLYAAASCSP